MFPAILACVAYVGLDASGAARVEPGAMATYEATRAKAGRDADTQVRLALWCESHGLQAERWKHLAIAVLADPGHAAARGLMGLVADRGGWRSPDAISARVSADPAHEAALAAYQGRRARMADTAEAHWKMALRCEQQGMKPEAAAHLNRVIQLDPGREAARKHLGYRKQGRRWVTDEQLAAERAEAEAQKQADRHWPPILNRWRGWIGDKTKEPALAEALATVTDPRAVPSIRAIFGRGKAAHQKAAVQLLGQIDSPDSTRALALLALDGKAPDVRARAIEILRLRDPRDVASLLVAMLREPDLDPDPILFHFQLTPTAGDALDAPGWLLVRGPGYDVVRSYTLPSWDSQPNSFLAWTRSARLVRQLRDRQIRDLSALVAQILRDSEEYIDLARRQAQAVDRSNARVIRALGATTGKDLGDDKEAWRKWVTEDRGYAYKPPAARPRQDLTFGDGKPTYYENIVSHSCFAAGTAVRTLTGPRPIESIAVGDQVLTQDPRTGALGYHPVVETPQNPPDRLFKIGLGGEAIRATGIHRFWKAGRGWVMACDLKPGDAIRALGGVATVESVEPTGVEPVFNLRVLEADSYLVGAAGLLVHDNSEVRPVDRPFDAAPEQPPATRSPASVRPLPSRPGSAQ